MRFAFLLVGACVLGCGGRVVVDHETGESETEEEPGARPVIPRRPDETRRRCSPATWTGHEGEPIAALGPSLPLTLDEAFVAKLGPFERDVRLDELELGAAPGWGCATPGMTRVGAWAGAEPAGVPLEHFSPLAVLGERDLGDGFTARRVRLEEPLELGAGESVLAGLLATEPQDCAAEGIGPGAGVAWHWREDTGWTELAGRVVLWAHGCEETSGEP